MKTLLCIILFSISFKASAVRFLQPGFQIQTVFSQASYGGAAAGGFQGCGGSWRLFFQKFDFYRVFAARIGFSELSSGFSSESNAGVFALSSIKFPFSSFVFSNNRQKQPYHFGGN